MKNTISARVADFLKQFPPFNEMQVSDLEALSQEVAIIYKTKESIIFEEDAAPHECFYVVHRGAVVLRKKSGNDVIDLCDEGDIFGLRPLMASENYKLEAKAYEESILYAVPIAIFKPYTQKYEGVANFLIESFASNTRNPYSKIYKGKLLGEMPSIRTQPSEGIFDLQHVHYSKKLVTRSEDTMIKAIALAMTRKKVGAMLIVRNELPIGIITDKDIRNKIASGEHPITAKAKAIMSAPV
ncbi:MAG: cyclic nucleotide-binding domain-containing protein, partial [Pricia sp.]